MAKRGKLYKQSIELYDKNKIYELEEAIDILKKFPGRGFDESIDASVKLNLNKNQRVRGIVVFPHIFGKPRRVVVIAKGEKAIEAERAGADFVGDSDIIEKIKGGWLDFDAVVATPDMMREVGKLGPILGRRGMMPNPKTGTVTFEVAKAINEIKQGKSEYRSDRNGVVGISVGKVSMEKDKLIENIRVFYESILKTRPPEAKGEYIKSFTLSRTMSPGVKIDYKNIFEKK